MSRTIVIVGANFAGLGVAQWLAPRAENADLKITLIDKRPYHEYYPLLYEVATGAANGSLEACEKILAGGVCVNLHTYDRILRDRRIAFRCDEVTAIDRRTRHLRLRSGETLNFDALVLAVGSETAYYGISGLREHAIPLKSVRDALRIRRRVLDFVERAKREKDARVAIVVGGGGATGVEFAAELARTCAMFVRRGELNHGQYTITLVEMASRLLGAFPDRLSNRALQRLHELGVRVHLDTTMQEVMLGRVRVAPRSLKDNEERSQLLCGFDGDTCELDADLVVWTGGIQYPSLPHDAGFPVDARGRIVVEDTFIVSGERCVFALGDCAACTPRGAQPLPPLASVAVREAPIAARNVLACLNDYPMQPYRPHVLPSIVPLGGKYAGFAYRRLVWIGHVPWFLRAFVDCKYFVSTFGLHMGLRVWWKGARAYMQND